MPQAVLAILSTLCFSHFSYANDPPSRSTKDEVAAIGELKKIGAVIENDDKGYAISLTCDSSTGSKFTDAYLKHVAMLPHLKELWLEHTSVTDSGLKIIRTMTQLETLGLICEYQTGERATITDCGLKHLKGLTNLRMLWLRDSDVTDCGLVHLQCLTKLENLSLFGTEISDAGLNHLRGLKNLTYLDVAETQWETQRGAITFDAVKELRKHLHGCKIDY